MFNTNKNTLKRATDLPESNHFIYPCALKVDKSLYALGGA